MCKLFFFQDAQTTPRAHLIFRTRVRHEVSASRGRNVTFAKANKIRWRTVTPNETKAFYIAVTRERDNERTGGGEKKTKDDDIFSHTVLRQKAPRRTHDDALTGLVQVLRATNMMMTTLLINPLISRKPSLLIMHFSRRLYYRRAAPSKLRRRKSVILAEPDGRAFVSRGFVARQRATRELESLSRRPACAGIVEPAASCPRASISIRGR